MVWSGPEYKKDENQVFTTLISLAGIKTPGRTHSNIKQAIDIICQKDVIVPQPIRDALRRVIRARRQAKVLYKKLGENDAGHDAWLLFISKGSERLERHARIITSTSFPPSNYIS